MERLATGEVVITLNDESIIAGLDRVRTKYAFTMGELNRQEAKLRIDLDTSKADASLKKFKAEKKALEDEIGKVNLGQFGSDKVIARMREDLKTLNAESKKASDEDFALKNRASKLVQGQILAEQRLSDAKIKSSEREYDLQRKAAVEHTRALEDNIRREAQGAKLRDAFSKQTDIVEKREREKPGFLATREIREKVGLETAAARAQLDAFKAEMELKGIDVPVHVKVDERSLRRLFRSKEDFTAGTRDLAAAGIGGIKNAAGSGFRVPLPFSTLRVPAGALAGAAPVIASLAGGVTSLAGVVGAGAAGAGAVGGGLLTGLISNFGGVVASIIPLKKQYEQLTQSTQKYEKAVTEYGKGSKQAVAAQAELNEVLRHTPKLLVEGKEKFEAVADEWEKRTGGIRTALSRMFLDAADAAKKLTPTLAANSTETAGILAGGFGNFTKNLTSPKEISGLDTLGKSTNEFLKPALVGVEGFTKALLHIGESAAKLFGGPFGKWIEGIGKDFERATQPGDKLDKKIKILGDDARDVGKFFGALGKVIVDMLGLAAPQGDKLTNTMTSALGRWDEKLKSIEGKKGFQKWIRESDELLKELAPLLEAVLKLIGGWAIGLIPAANVVLGFANGITKVVNGLGKMLGLGSGVKSLGAVLGGLFIASKALAFASALNKIYETLKAMAVLGAAGDIAGALKLPLTAGAAGGVAAKDAEKAGGSSILKTLGIGAAGGGAGEAVATIGAGTAALAVAASAAAIGVGILGGKLTELVLGAPAKEGPNYFENEIKRLKNYRKAAKDAAQGAYELASPLLQADTGFNQSKAGVDNARKALNQLNHEGKHGTVEYKEALLEYRTAVNLAAEAERNRNKISHTQIDAIDKSVFAARKAKGDIEEKIKAREGPTPGLSEAAKVLIAEELAKLEQEREVAARELVKRLNEQEVTLLNIQRAQQNLEPITEPAGVQAIGELSRKPQTHALAQKIALKYEVPADASKVAQAAINALAKGVSVKAVIKAEADTHSAKEAISELNKDVAQRVKEIKKTMHDGAGNAVSAFTEGFGKINGAVKSIWSGAENTTKTALKNINKLLLAELKVLNGGKIPTLAEGGPPLAPGVEKVAAEGKAEGGLVQFGRAGDKGADKIPATMMVGSGEVGAVFTGRQQKVANEYLAPIGGLPGLFNKYNTPHYMASGGIIRGPVSYFGPPGEAAGGTAYGSTSAAPGIAVNPDGGSNWNDARARSFAGKVARVTVSGHSANLKVIDKGPSAIGSHGPRVIDITGAGVRAMGINPASFPTDSIGTADFGGGRLLASAKGVSGATAATVTHQIPKQKIPLHGLVGQIVSAGVEKARHAANKLLQKLGGEGGGPLFSGPTPAGVTVPRAAWNPLGKPIDKWIVPILAWAHNHGWKGTVASGYRTFAEQSGINASGAFSAAAGTSNHEKPNYPGGAVDVSDDYGLSAALSHYRRRPTLIGHVLGPVDPEHFSATGRARGGFVKRPALLVGEHENEWVINPKRADNHAYLKEAGEEMGYHVTPAAKGKAKKGGVVKHFAIRGSLPPVSFSEARAIPASLVENPLHDVEKTLTAERAAYVKVENAREKTIESLKNSKSKAAHAIYDAQHSSSLSVASARKAQSEKQRKAGEKQTKAGQYYVEPGAPNPQKEAADKASREAGDTSSVRKAEIAADKRIKNAEFSARGKIGSIEKKLKHYEEGLKKIKGGGVWEHTDYIKWSKLEHQQEIGRKSKNALKGKEAEVGNLNKSISAQTHDLSILKSHYDRLTKNKGETGARKTLEDEWNAKFNARQGKLHTLSEILKSSKSEAAKFENTRPSPEIKIFLEGIDPEIEAVENSEDQAESEKEAGPTASREIEEKEGGGGPTSEQFLTERGKIEGLKKAEELFALAGAKLTPDNPNTPLNEELPGLKEELTPAESIKQIWESALGEAQALKEPPSTIIDIANATTAARSTAFGLKQSIEGAEKATASQHLQELTSIGTERYELLKNFGSNFAPISLLPGAQAAASISQSGRSGIVSQPASKTVNLNVENHFSQPPPNAHHWSNGVAWELGAVI